MHIQKQDVIKKVAEFVKQKLYSESTGHDWWHCYRVWQLALKIAKNENADLFVVQLAALLHDIADWKFNKPEQGLVIAKELLNQLNVDEQTISHVCEIIRNISFKGAKVKNEISTKEGRIVQDADRLDALGAIGIARCFATGAKLGRPIYDPNIKPKLHTNFDEYKKAKSTSINHFYEKLLLLKDRMNTETARKIAEERHKFMLQFLDRFFREWNCEE